MEINNTLLEKYLEGTLSEKEEKLVEEWFLKLRAVREKAAIQEQWNNFSDNKENKQTEISTRDLLKKTLHFILKHDKKSEEPVREDLRSKIKTLSLVDEPGMSVPLSSPKRRDSKPAGKAFQWPSVTKWAAVVLLLLTTGYFGYYHFGRANESLAGNAGTEFRIKETVPGQKSTIYLEDGSKVTLNSMSQLVYPETFGGDTREITLRGEAFFEVAKDTARPFIVTTGDISTTALGTSFNIRAYQKDENIQVALVTGKVSVAHNSLVTAGKQEEIVLLPGDAAYYGGGRKTLEKGRFKAKKTLSWKERILYFDQTELSEAFEILERWYGIHLTVNGELEKPLYLNGEFHDESLKNVLEVLSYSQHFSYQIFQDEVYINLSEKP